MFRIEIFDRWPGFRINGRPANYGRIRWANGPYEYETFIAPTDLKSCGWYRRQWDAALRRLLAGQGSSSLVVSAGNPEVDWIQVWDIWNVGTPTALMQNRYHIPPAGRSPGPKPAQPFDIDRPWDSAGAPDDATDPPGARASQWEIPLEAIEEFIGLGGPLAWKPSRRVWPAGWPGVRNRTSRRRT